MNIHFECPPKKARESVRIRGYTPIFVLLGMFFAAIAYGGTGNKEILSAEERAWLAQNQTRLVLAVETGYAPFVFLDSKDQPTGFAHDYLRLIESKLGAHFKQRRFSSLNDIFEKVHSGEVHIVNAVTNTPERAKFLAMTSSFVSVPNVIVVRKERSGQMREKDLPGLKVSLVKSYAVTEHLTNTNPRFAPNLVPDDLTALLNVSFGQSDAAVIDLATASYLISQKGIANLRVAGEVNFDIRLAIGSPLDEPVLHNILQKGLDAVTKEERQEIRDRWISAPGQSIFTDQRVWVVILAIIVVIALILVWNRILRQQLAFRTEALARERKYLAEREQLELQLSRRLHHRDVMERITQISFESRTIEEMLEKVLDEILSEFNADRAWFLHPCDPDAPSWSVPMERTRPEWPGASARGTAIPMTPEVAEVFREVIASTKPLPYGPAAPRSVPAMVAEQFSIRSQIQMALRPRIGSHWAMGLHHCAQAHAYDEDELLLFNDIGQRVADALNSMIMLNSLRESESRLNFLVSNNPVTIYTCKPTVPFGATYISNNVTLNFGYSPEQFTERSEFWAENIHPDDRQRVFEHLPQLFKHGMHQHEYRFRLSDGSYRWVHDELRLVRDEAGETTEIIGYWVDITQRKEYEEELKRSNIDLEQFAYAVSHDMRQPLRMISSYLQLLEIGLAGQLDSEKRGYFDIVIKGAKRIDQMLMELLEYSRVGKMGEPPTWIESRAVLDEALQFLQPAITEAQAKVNIDGDWPRILVSHDEILRLLQNLIGNAVKFRVAGRVPVITVNSEMVNNEWQLCVADNGVGIIPEQIKRLFLVFQRLQPHESYEGTGIGLALCRKIAEHHKGRIWAESEGEGKGSRFWVVLPVLQDKK